MVRGERETIIASQDTHRLLQSLGREVEGNLLVSPIVAHLILLIVKTAIEDEEVALINLMKGVVAVEILRTREDIAYGYALEREGSDARIFAFTEACNGDCVV